MVIFIIVLIFITVIDFTNKSSDCAIEKILYNEDDLGGKPTKKPKKDKKDKNIEKEEIQSQIIDSTTVDSTKPTPNSNKENKENEDEAKNILEDIFVNGGGK